MQKNPMNSDLNESSDKQSQPSAASRSPQRRSPTNTPTPQHRNEMSARPAGQHGPAAGGPRPGQPTSQGGAPRTGEGPVPYRPASSFDRTSRPSGGPASGRPPSQSGPYRPASGNQGSQSGPYRPSGPGGQGRPGGGPSGGRRPSGPVNGRPQNGNGRSGGRPGDRRSASSGPMSGPGRAAVAVKPKPTEPVAIPPQIAVRDLAGLLEVQPNEIIRALFDRNILASINQVITYESAATVAKELGYETLEAAPPPT